MPHPYVLFGSNTRRDVMVPVIRGDKSSNCDLKSTITGDNGSNIMVRLLQTVHSLG